MDKNADEREHQQEHDLTDYHGDDTLYIDLILSSYRRNPLIEALPPIYTEKEAHSLLGMIPAITTGSTAISRVDETHDDVTKTSKWRS